MRIVQVVAGLDDRYGGPSYAVTALSRALGRWGADVSVHVLSAPPGLDLSPARIEVHPSARLLPRLGISSSLRRALAEEARDSDIIHTHGLWMMPNVYPARAIRGTACRVVISPHGMLQPWAIGHHRWRKRAMWLAFQGRAMRGATCIHAAAPAEAEGIRRLSPEGAVAVVPNGIDLPEDNGAPVDREGRRRLLFLGRLHPVKGVDLLIRAWRGVQARFPDWDLVIAGPPDFPGYRDRLEGLIGTLGAERVRLAGAAFGEDRSAAYRAADLCVLPTRGESFGITVAEALSHGVPVVVTRAAPWAGVPEEGCGWWIDTGVEALEACLGEALALPREELSRRGSRGREWMARDFSWDRIGAMMGETYRWLVRGGVAPSWVDAGGR